MAQLGVARLGSARLASAAQSSRNFGAEREALLTLLLDANAAILQQLLESAELAGMPNLVQGRASALLRLAVFVAARRQNELRVVAQLREQGDRWMRE